MLIGTFFGGKQVLCNSMCEDTVNLFRHRAIEAAKPASTCITCIPNLTDVRAQAMVEFRLPTTSTRSGFPSSKTFSKRCRMLPRMHENCLDLRMARHLLHQGSDLH